jgi:AraC-like DNA-binding protein
MGEVVEVAPPRGVGGPGAVRVTSNMTSNMMTAAGGGGSARPGRAGAPISTMLTADERMRVDAAGHGLYHTLHRESIEDVLRDLRTRQVSAVIVSVASLSRCDRRETERVAAMVREFPRVPAVALLTAVETATPRAVLALGQSGVRTLIDVRQPTGWGDLRQALATDGRHDLERLVSAALAADLPDAREDCVRWLESLFTLPPRVCTVRVHARALGVRPSTFMSRFFRLGLPAPKRYLAMARLVRAARQFENPGCSIAAVANRLEYSSPQSFGRHVRMLLDLSAGEFRERYDGEGMLQRFRDELVLPYREALSKLAPLGR